MCSQSVLGCCHNYSSRRDFLKQSMYLGAAAVVAGPLGEALDQTCDEPGSKTKFGLVTWPVEVDKKFVPRRRDRDLQLDGTEVVDVVVDGSKFSVIRKRETYEDLIALEKRGISV